MKRWCDFIGGKMWLDPDADGMEALMAAGQWEHRKVALLQKYLKPGMTFVDAGAHWGYFSLIAASLGARVIAVEPELTYNYQWLSLNFTENGYLFEGWPVALWSEDGSQPFYQGYNSGTHSLIINYEGEKGQVATKSLDSLLFGELPDVMKIDVEGADMQVLRGADNTLKRAKNMTIVMDLHPELYIDNEVVGLWLQWHGFRLYDIRSDNAPIETIPPTMVELLALKGYDA